MKSVAIIGGGIIGRISAFVLSEEGYQVTVFDSSQKLTAPSWNNAGHIAVEQVAPLSSYASIRTAPKRLFRVGGALDFNLFSPGVASWVWRYLRASSPSRFKAGTEALASLVNQAETSWQALTTRAHVPDVYQGTGHWVVWESAGSATAASRHWSGSNTGNAQFTALAPSQMELVRQRTHAHVENGIAFSGTGRITNLPLLADTLKKAIIDNGGNWENRAISPLTQANGKAVIPAFERDFDAVVMCAGAASGRLLRHIYPNVPLIAERGYHLEVSCTEEMWPSNTPPLVFEDRSMIVTRFANTLRACSFVEFSDLDAPADERKWQRLLEHCKALGLPIGDDAKKWMGARPTLPDYLPAIGKSQRASNLYYAFGHQHLGLTLGAITGEKLAAMITGNPSPSELKPFDIERFKIRRTN